MSKKQYHHYYRRFFNLCPVPLTLPVRFFSNMFLYETFVHHYAAFIDQGSAIEKKPHIIIATPGRINEHLIINPTLLSKIRFLVLDEADQLFSINFLPEIANTLTYLNRRRQNILVSATIHNALDAFKQVLELKKDIYSFGIAEK